jgi:hypothetical protein
VASVGKVVHLITGIDSDRIAGDSSAGFIRDSRTNLDSNLQFIVLF